MGRHQHDDDPTHTIAMDLQRKLVEAKQWYDKGLELEKQISQSSGPGSAQRNADDRDAHERDAAPLLAEIVEMCGAKWGFAEPQEWS
jgi:hypothetical protein